MKFERFAELFSSTLQIGRAVRREDRLRDDLQLDSLDLLEIWVAVEYAAGRPVEPSAVESLETVEDAYLLLQTLAADQD